MNDFINNVRYYWDEYGIQTVLIVLLISVFVLFQWMDYEDVKAHCIPTGAYETHIEIIPVVICSGSDDNESCDTIPVPHTVTNYEYSCRDDNGVPSIKMKSFVVNAPDDLEFYKMDIS